jgi:hypothetical protein
MKCFIAFSDLNKKFAISYTRQTQGIYPYISLKKFGHTSDISGIEPNVHLRVLQRTNLYTINIRHRCIYLWN